MAWIALDDPVIGSGGEDGMQQAVCLGDGDGAEWPVSVRPGFEALFAPAADSLFVDVGQGDGAENGRKMVTQQAPDRSRHALPAFIARAAVVLGCTDGPVPGGAAVIEVP
jgi:hypothetical protein